MKKMILFAVSFFAAGAVWAQQAGTQAVNADSVPIEEYVPEVIIEGKWGTGPGEFGVAWTYASDTESPMSPSGSKSMPIYPSSLAVDGKGNIYVLDAINNRIQKFDAEGKFLKAIAVDAYMGEEQPIWYGTVKAEDGREILDRVDSKGKSGKTVGVDAWFPYYWPITIEVINIVIDSKDTLYYYLKRTKDGKETGEVWEFRKDKLVSKAEVPLHGGVYYEAPLGLFLEEDDSIWLFNVHEQKKKTDLHYEIKSRKKYTSKARHEKLVGAKSVRAQVDKPPKPLNHRRHLDLKITENGVQIVRDMPRE